MHSTYRDGPLFGLTFTLVVAATAIIAVATPLKYALDITGPVYSTGSRSGILQKFSTAGIIWKTNEGELAMQGIKTRGMGEGKAVSSTFEFSVTDQGISARLRELMDSDAEQHVTLRYEQHWFSGRCNSEYRIIGVSESQ